MTARVLAALTLLFSLLFLSSQTSAQTGKKWLDMNYGPFFSGSVQAPGPGKYLTYKALVLRVDG